MAGDSTRARGTPARPVTDSTAEDWLDRVTRPSIKLSIAAVISVALLVWGVATTAWSAFQLDLQVYLLGARHLFDGSIYAVRISLTPHLPFTYTPFAGLFFLPLTVFSFHVAKLIWLIISLAALVSLIALSLWAMRPDLDRARLWLATAVLSGPMFFLEPIKSNFHFGQINIVLGLMVFSDLVLVLRIGGRTIPRGILVGIASAVKLIPLVFVAYLFVTRQFKAACVASASFAVCTALAFAANPHASWQYWTKYAYDAKRIGSIFYLSNQSLRGALDRMAHVELSPALVTGLALVVLAAGLLLSAWAYRRSSAVLGILVAATTGMVCSPITWTHHLVWSIPILLWLALAPDRPVGGQWWSLAGAVLLWTSPMWAVSSIVTDELNENLIESLAANSFFWGMVAFLVGIAILLAHRNRRGSPRLVSP